MEKLQSFDLRLEKYCEFCPYFKPDVDKTEITSYKDSTPKFLTTISCEHHGKCEQIMARAKEVANEKTEKI